MNIEFNLHTDASYLNCDFNEQFLSSKVSMLDFSDKDIILNGSAYEEKALNIIASGRVRVVKPMPGKEQVITYEMSTGCILGVEAIISGSNVIPLIVSAVGDVTVYRVHHEDLISQLRSPEVLKGLFNHYIRTMHYVINPSAS